MKASFEDLAARIWEGSATPEEMTAFRRRIEAHPREMEDWQAIEQEFTTLDRLLPLVRTLQQSPRIPAEASGPSSRPLIGLLGATGSVLAALWVFFSLQWMPPPLPHGAGPAVAREVAAIALPLDRLATEFPFVAAHTHPPVVLYGPGGRTRFLQPPIDWRAEDPEASYDITLKIPGNTTAGVLHARGVVPPVPFAKLAGPEGSPSLLPQTRYVLRVQRSDNPRIGVTRRFATAPAEETIALPPDPEARLTAARKALFADPPHPADSWLLLRALPPEVWFSEAALRLRLLAARDLGLRLEYEQAVEAIARIQLNSSIPLSTIP